MLVVGGSISAGDIAEAALIAGAAKVSHKAGTAQFFLQMDIFNAYLR